MRDELDKNLQSLFEEKSRSLTEEPFLGNILRLIEKKRRSRRVVRWLAYVLGFACCAYLSPFLIKGSVVLSAHLRDIFSAINSCVTSPVGMSVTVFILIFVSFRRRRVWNSNATTSKPGI